MRLCWAGDSDERLSFSKIVQRFEEYLTELMNYVKPSAGGFVDPYSHWNLSAAKEMTVALPQLLSKGEDEKLKENRASDLASKNFNLYGAMFTLDLESVEC